MNKVTSLNFLELFSGAGGLALAAKRAGFTPLALFDWDRIACETLKINARLLGNGKSPQIIQADLRKMSPDGLNTGADVLIGGPPCQPFSRGGCGRGPLDKRDLFPQFSRFVHELRPKVFFIENVAGLLNGRFLDYFEQIMRLLSFPSKKKPSLSRLHEGQPVFNSGSKPDYRIFFKVMNAADYGVPQNRLRLFIVGIRNDLTFDWHWPKPTHSREALLKEKFITGKYFLKYNLEGVPYKGHLEEFAKKITNSPKSCLKPHRTIRDAIADLPEPIIKNCHISHHILVPGARVYEGHSGSEWDQPGKTIKAGVHGCPGGENMLRMGKTRVRYFTVRELARIQSFPDTYRFHGTRNQCVKQIGNAVPVLLGARMLEILSSLLRNHGMEKIKTGVAA